MTRERPDDAREPEDTAGPADGDDGLEAQRASASDAPFRGLRSAADIFGAPRSADEWPSRRERREAERAARETGAPLPEPFTSDVPTAPASAAESAEPADGRPAPLAERPVPPAVTPSVPAAREPDDAGATQAIRMDDELQAPSVNPQASAEHERETLGERIPPAAPVPPTSTTQHPSSITLPTALTHRDERAAENRAVDEERRRTDPFGQGRSDVDWLGRATGAQTPPPPVTPTGPVAQPLGVHGVLPPTPAPSTGEPPSFTELLRLQGVGDDERGATERPFDWAIRDDETGEVPTTLTTDSFDTTAFGAGSWSLADEADDDVVSGEVDTPADGTTVLPIAPPPAAAPASSVPAPASAPAAEPVASAPAPEPSSAVEPSEPPTGATPWWAAPDAAAAPVPPLVEPAPRPASEAATTRLPFPLDDGQDVGHEADHDDDAPGPRRSGAPAATDADEIDQSEWDGRETSDTSAIKDLFGTAAVGQLGATGYDPHETGTRMMPAVPSADRAAAPRATAEPAQPNRAAVLLDEGVSRLKNEGKRGKQLLIGGAVVLIVVLLVAVFALTRWILGGSIEESTPAPSSTAAASAPATPDATPESGTAQGSTQQQPAATLQFATTQATPGVHPWTDLAGGECLSPFTNAWDQSYTVIDCSSPHTAQLTARVQVSASQWPGPEALAEQASKTCQSSEAIDTAAAAKIGDVQVQGSYAPDQATWDQGNTFISCFATRAQGQMLTGSLAPDGK